MNEKISTENVTTPDTDSTGSAFFGVPIPTFDLPKFELPKFDLSKVDFLKVDLPKVDLSAFTGVADSVKTAASDTMLTATQTATKVRNSASHTVTLVREAVGV
jgi:hypothetical protein